MQQALLNFNEQFQEPRLPPFYSESDPTHTADKLKIAKTSTYLW